MSADNDGDSHMTSSPSDSEPSNPTTAPTKTTSMPATSDPATLSPPSSGTRSSAHHNGANANGKRPLNALSNGDAGASAPATSEPSNTVPIQTAQNGKQQSQPQLKSRSGKTPQGRDYTYTWTKVEDEPGYGWTNKKVQDEAARAYEGMAHKDIAVGNKYGDPFEMAETEAAELESLKS